MKALTKRGTRAANKLFSKFDLKLVGAKDDLLYYLHDYGDGGYAQYRQTQIFHNRRKIDKVWADDATLKVIADYLAGRLCPKPKGLCHGARNGYEVRKLGELLGAEMTGTDISKTASDYPGMVTWDFHDPNPAWENAFDFIYTNSLDQAFDPEKALAVWSRQIRDDGLVFIEHTMEHAVSGACDMDPFGAHPMIMPYLFHQWGKGRYRLVDIVKPDHLKFDRLELWIFVLARCEK